MEHCKKMVLLPHEALAKFHEKPASRTSGDVMNDLDQEMSRILKQRAADSEKWKMYEQALQKYLYFVNEQKKPTALIFPETNTKESEIERESESPRDTVLKDRLLTLIPEKFKNAASALYEHLSTPEARAYISWDRNGTTSVGGETFSSIIDLISDAVRTRKQPKVSRWQTFASVLRTLHTPLDIVGNKKYIQAIQSQDGAGLAKQHVRNTETNAQIPRKCTAPQRTRHLTKTTKNKYKCARDVKNTKWKRWA